MVELVSFTAEAAADMTVRDLSPEMERLVRSPSYLQFLEMGGHGYILVVEGRKVGAAVFVPLLYSGTAEIVMLMTPLVQEYPRIVHRLCKRLIDEIQDAHRYHRIEARIPEAAERDRRWAEAMGFIAEGTAEAFGSNGENYVQYARVRKDLLCQHL